MRLLGAALLAYIPLACFAADEARVLAVATDVLACERLARAVEPYGIRIAVVEARAETLEALAADGSDLRSQYDAVFLQQGRDLAKRLGNFDAMLCDAMAEGLGLVVEGGPEGYADAGLQSAHLARWLPVIAVAPGPTGTRTGRADRPTVQDEHSGLLRFLGWASAPTVGSYNLLEARRDAKVHLAADVFPLLVTWRVGDANIVAFAGGLTGTWAERWNGWSSFDAFRARLFRFAAGTDEQALKSIMPVRSSGAE
ncbi:MAG: hypothetical protein HRF45_02850 [Fimbriimonadia bacterium]|jgi:hypothetical protein